MGLSVRCWSILLLLGCALALLPTSVDASGCPLEKSKGDFTINFLGVTNNPDGSSTWYYTLEWDGDPDPPEHLTIELCKEAMVVDSSPPHDEIAFDATTGIFGILWNTPNFPVDEPVTYSFTLNRQYASEKIKWAVRSDGHTDKSDICGPDKDCTVTEPFPISDLVCDLVDPCTCEVLVTWNDPETLPHQTIISVDGVIVETLPGGSSNFMLTLPDSGDHDICVRNVFDPSENFRCISGDCGECSGGVNFLTLRYDGAATANVTVDDDGDILFSGSVDPGEEFSFVGTGNSGKMSSNIDVLVDDVQNANIHTSCSQAIYVGQVHGDFTITEGASVNGGPLCDCNECDGGVNFLELRYNGAVAAEITVDDGDVLFNGTVAPGETFSFAGTGNDGEMNNDVEILIDDEQVAEIHASCSQPIGIGSVFGDFEVVQGSSIDGGPFCETPPCNECDGGVNFLTLQYDGAAAADITVDDDGDILFMGNVAAGGQFSFVGTGNDGKMSSNIDVLVDGVQNVNIHTSCSQPIFAGSIFGDFTVIEGTSVDGGPLCPAPPCSECDGDVSELSLEYLGGSPATIQVVQKNGDTVFNDMVSPGEKFAFVGTDKGDFGSEINIFVDGIQNTEIHTSCSQPIGPGLISGDFEVISGVSTDGGPLCPVGPIGCNDLCDVLINGASACVCCTVSCPDIPPTPPVDLMCMEDEIFCNVTITWTNTSNYESINIFLNGALAGTVSGDTQEFFIAGPLQGPAQVCLEGETVCGEPFPPVCTECNCECLLPDPVLNLSCTLVDPCSCEVFVSWTNAEENYEAIEITLDGMVVATLPGDAMNTTVFIPQGDVVHTICATPIRCKPGMMQCCMIECPDIPANSPIGLNCDVTCPECVASMSWQNQSQYEQIEITLDGAVVATLPGTAEAASIQLPGPGTYELCVTGETICGEAFEEVCCTVVCPGPPQPVADLDCIVKDICDCAVIVSWTNLDPDYDSIQVFVDGILNTTLPGDTDFITLILNPGVHEICIVPMRECLDAAPVCCMIECPDIPALPPADLNCVPDTSDCSIAVSWTNQSQYQSIEVVLDGTVIQTLPGDATMATIPGPLQGMHEVCLQGLTICGDPFMTCCMTNCDCDDQLPVENLECMVDPCSCEATITWTNPAVYDSIMITLDGVEVASLAGNATSHVLTLPDNNPHTVCVIPIRCDRTMPETCCTVECPSTDPAPPIILVCEVDNPADCNVTLTWSNQSLYSVIEIFVNGVLEQTLPGDAESAMFQLDIQGTIEICLQGQTICNEAFEEVCCEITCQVPEPQNPTCEVTDPCGDCVATVTWMNPIAYDEIQIFLDGGLDQTLPGTATSAMVSLGGPGDHTICVVGVNSGVPSEMACCDPVNCPVIEPSPIMGFTCDVTGFPPECMATLSWTNGSVYAELIVTVDGQVVAILPGDAEGAVVPLPGAGIFTICVSGTTICEEDVPEVCCEVQCETPFIRGECNDDDRGLDIADAIFVVNFLFQNGPMPPCFAACDVNRDGMVNIADVIFMVNFAFIDGPAPSAPWPDCAPEPGADCEVHTSCQD